MKSTAILSAGLIFTAFALAEGNETNPLGNSNGANGRIDGRGNIVRGMPRRGASTGANTTGNGINYNGGPVMLGTIHMYYIWYGDWAGKDPGGPAIINDFADNVGGSPYFSINTTYFNSSNQNVSNSVTRANSVTGRLTNSPTTLTDANIWTIVQNGITDGLPVDPNGVYFVLTAPGIAESSGFLTKYCGWHTYNFYNNTPIKYSFVGNAAGPNLGSCAWQTGGSPNNDPGADAMISVIAHELEEAVTDPQLNAWYDSAGAENADKCAWTFGTTYNPGNNSMANVKLGTRDYLIQRNWVNASGGYCSMSFASTPDYSLSVSPSSQTVVKGNTTGAYTVTITPTNSFSGSVTLNVTGLPSGASASISPNPATTSASFTVTTTSITPAGTFPLTITGTSGTLSHTSSASLVVAQPDFSLGVSPSSQSVTQGGTTGSYGVTISPVNGFSGAVTLSATGLPSGATASAFSTNPATSTSSFTVSTLATLAAGSYPFTITGTSGTLSHNTAATLVVNAVGSFTISIAPTSLSVGRNKTNSYSVTINRTGGFSSSVQLSVSGLPSRTSGSFSPNPTTGSTSTLTISANRNAQLVNNKTITVTAVGGGITKTATASLSVTQ